MYTAQSCLDMHDRSHRTLKKLLDHCRLFTVDEINSELPGFGYPSIRLQLFHIIGTERYWIGVVLGRLLDDKDDLFSTIDSLEAYRRQVAIATEEYLKLASDQELNTPRKMIIDPNEERILMPARIIVRVLTHNFHHQGQILAMCRLLEKPGGGINFPIL